MQLTAACRNCHQELTAAPHKSIGAEAGRQPDAPALLPHLCLQHTQSKLRLLCPLAALPTRCPTGACNARKACCACIALLLPRLFAAPPVPAVPAFYVTAAPEGRAYLLRLPRMLLLPCQLRINAHGPQPAAQAAKHGVTQEPAQDCANL